MKFRNTPRGRVAVVPEPLSAALAPPDNEPTPVPTETVEAAEESLVDRWDALAQEAEVDSRSDDAEQLVARPRRHRSRDALVASALDMVKAALMEDDDERADLPPQPIHIHNHLPTHNLSVDVAPAQVTPEIRIEPAQINPHFTLEAPTAPDVHVSVEPPQVTVEQPAITVEQPEITVQAPEVHVSPPDVHVAAPNVTVEVPQTQRPSAIRVETDEDGNRVFVPVEE